MIPIIVGIVGIAITVALHAIATTFIVHLLKTYAISSHQRFGRYARPFIIGFTAAALAVKHFVDIGLWAIAYQNFAGPDQFEDFEAAVYFSSVTYTSLGYGDVVLTGSWRILCGIQAMNGILLFGWSTALLFLLVQRMWFADEVPIGKNRNQDATERSN